MHCWRRVCHSFLAGLSVVTAVYTRPPLLEPAGAIFFHPFEMHYVSAFRDDGLRFPRAKPETCLPPDRSLAWAPSGSQQAFLLTPPSMPR